MSRPTLEQDACERCGGRVSVAIAHKLGCCWEARRALEKLTRAHRSSEQVGGDSDPEPFAGAGPW